MKYIELELGRAIDVEMRRIDINSLPAAYLPEEPGPATVIQFATEVDRQTFAAMVTPWLYCCSPTLFWVVIFPVELAPVLEQLQSTRTVA